ncbi:MAG: hypothetical protein P1U32_02145 [Legionellaceae bacterium]|nr:hypothetical protein [Legionellaceae bacterium]
MTKPEDEKALITATLQALNSLARAVDSGRGYHKGFEQVGHVASQALFTLSEDSSDVPSWLHYTHKELLEQVTPQLERLLENIKCLEEQPYIAWEDCHTPSEISTHALYAVEKVIRAFMNFLTVGYVQSDRQHQFFKGAEEPQILKDAISDLNSVSEQIHTYLNPSASNTEGM